MATLDAPGVRGERSRARTISVLFVDHETRLSGGQQDLVDLVGALDRSIDVHVALPGEGPLADALRARGAAVHPIPMGGALRRASRWDLARRPWLGARYVLGLLRTTIALATLIRRVRPAVIHTNSMKAHLAAALPSSLLRVPWLMHVRDILPEGWLRRMIASIGGAWARKVVCLSQVTADQFAGTRAARKVAVVHNGIAVDTYERGADTARDALGASAAEPLVGLVGQIAHWKGQDLFIEAAALVAGRHPCRFVIVGECLVPENEAEFERTIRSRVSELGLEERLVWAGWRDDMPAVMRGLDVLVHVSRLPEPFGRVLVEAMAAGTPVISTTHGSGPEVVGDDGGLLVPPNDVSALASAIESLVVDPERRRSAGESARRAARRFDISATARAVEGLYASVVRP